MSPAATEPIYPISSENHAAYVVITCGILISWTVLVFLMRMYIRFQINGRNAKYFGHDDSTFTFGTVVAIIQTGVTLAAVNAGLGQSASMLTPSHIEQSLRLNLVASVLYIIVVAASKCSVSLLVARLTLLVRHRAASNFVTAFTAAWALIAVFVIAFGCNLSALWDTVAPNCYHLLTRWIVVESFSMTIEVMLFCLSLYFAWDIHMAWSSKAVVVGAFSCRLLIIIPTVVRLYLLNDAINGPDPTINGVSSIITTQVVMHFSIMAATIPCMRPFLRAFDSGMGYSTTMGVPTGSNLNSKYAEDSSYALRSVDSDIRKPRHAKLRPDKVETRASIRGYPRLSHTAAGSIDSDGDESNKMIIRKTQEWEVVNEIQEV